MLALLMEQGAAYKKIIDSEDVTVPTKDEPEIIGRCRLCQHRGQADGRIAGRHEARGGGRA